MSGGRFTLRAARPGDAEAVVDMCRRLSRHEGQPAPGFEARHFRRDGFGDEAAFFPLIAEAEGRPAGYVLTSPGFDARRARDGVEMMDLYVEPCYRGRGLGIALMREVARQAAAWQGEFMSWAVRADNRTARQFYVRLGAERPEDGYFALDDRTFERLARRPLDARRTPVWLARAADAAAIDALWHGRRTAFAAAEDPSTWRSLAAGLLRGAGPARCLVAELDGRVAGYAVTIPSYDTQEATRGGYLSDLYVAPGARRRGLGTVLLAGAVQSTSAAGGEWLFWRILASEESGRHFSAAHGHRLKGIVPCRMEGETLTRLVDP
jgi:ribosomal protein S18 acetylase RimI-like enzyme